MPTLAQVRQQIQAYKHSYIFWTQKEVRALPEILDHDEVIKAVTSGFMNGSTWLVVCTQRRLIFLNRGMFYGLRQVQLPLARIQSIDHSFTIAVGSISVWDGASSFTVNMILKPSIIPFVRATEEAMNALTRPTPQPEQPLDVASQLEKLVELKEKGYLTEEEFQDQKKRLLS